MILKRKHFWDKILYNGLFGETIQSFCGMNNNRMEFYPVYPTGQKGSILYTDPFLYQLACEKRKQLLAVRVGSALLCLISRNVSLERE